MAALPLLIWFVAEDTSKQQGPATMTGGDFQETGFSVDRDGE
jgi:hypothetical protein